MRDVFDRFGNPPCKHCGEPLSMAHSCEGTVEERVAKLKELQPSEDLTVKVSPRTIAFAETLSTFSGESEELILRMALKRGLLELEKFFGHAAIGPKY